MIMHYHYFFLQMHQCLIGTILSTVNLLFSAIIIAATITEVQSVQVSSTIVTTYHVYNLDK